MAKKNSFQADDKGIAQILFSSKTAALCKQKAEEIAAEVRATAPVDDGEYRDNIRVVEDITDRVVARVVAEAPHSMVVENKHGTLTKAMIRRAQ